MTPPAHRNLCDADVAGKSFNYRAAGRIARRMTLRPDHRLEHAPSIHEHSWEIIDGKLIFRHGPFDGQIKTIAFEAQVFIIAECRFCSFPVVASERPVGEFTVNIHVPDTFGKLVDHFSPPGVLAVIHDRAFARLGFVPRRTPAAECRGITGISWIIVRKRILHETDAIGKPRVAGFFFTAQQELPARQMGENAADCFVV